MRICVDLDGVICQLRIPGQSYGELQPVDGAAQALRDLRAHGHYIIVHTARHMKTTEANVGQVVARVGAITLEWLNQHGIEYDEVHFGKPWADIYIDDNALRFQSWTQIDPSGTALPQSQESTAGSAQAPSELS